MRKKSFSAHWVAKAWSALFILHITALPLALHAQSNYRTESAKIFASNTVATIKIEIAPAFLNYILNPANAESDSLFPARFIFQNENIAGDTLEPVGFRLRGNTSRTSPKKSFKIDINEYVHGQKFYGLEKLNVNGEHNDPSIMRSRLCWNLFEQAGVPGARATYAALYINNQYYGLYIIVEHYDENFILDRFGNNDGNLYKCLYPAPLTWRGADQAAYKFPRNARERAYDLETNEAKDDYADLVSFINFLNNTSDADFARELEARFNVRAFLKYLAHNTLLGSWDDYWYLQNNYYLYHNTATDKFEFIPYDYDNTYGIDFVNGDWGTRNIYNFGNSNDPRPLVTRILNIPAYRNLYSFYMKEALRGVFTLAAHEPKLAQWRALAEPWVQSDPYYPIQWRFTFATWQQALDVAFGGHVEYGIRPFIQTRSASATQQLQEGPLPTEITEVQWEPQNPAPREDVLVKCRVLDGGATITRVDLLYSVAGGPSVLAAMYDDGQHFDGAANDGVYAGKIFGQAPGKSLEFYLRAQSSAAAWTIYPTTAPYKKILVRAATRTFPLVVNEFMAQNTRTITDPIDGDWEDWVEIYNTADTAVALNGMFLTDNLASPQKWQFPDTSLPAKSFLLVWTDNEAAQGKLHTNFALSRNGEQIGLFAPLALGNFPIDTLSFTLQKADTSYGRTSDGASTWRFFATPTPGRANVSTSVHAREEQKILPEAFRLESVWPNPAAKSVNVRLRIEQAGVYEIALFDVLGRRILQKFSYMPARSASSIILSLNNAKAGVYFLIVSIEGHRRNSKLVILK